MTPAKLAELEEKAKAATPGPWAYCYDGSSDFSVGKQDDPQDQRVCSVYDHTKEGNDAAYIAAANPQTILELIAAYRKAVEALDFVYKNLGVPQPGYPAPVAYASDMARDTLKELGVLPSVEVGNE